MDHETGVKITQGIGMAVAQEIGKSLVAQVVLPEPVSAVVAGILAAGRLGLHAAGGTGTQRLRAAVQNEIEGAVLTVLPEVLRRIEQLEANGSKVNASDFATVVENFARSWSGAADAKKRKLLEDAFVRSFDPELYESGVLNALWDKLDRLSYGDLNLLRDFGVAGKGAGASVQAKHDLKNGTSEGRYHAFKLLSEGLCWSPAAQQDPSFSGGFKLIQSRRPGSPPVDDRRAGGAAGS
jgi:hypothetical protein